MKIKRSSLCLDVLWGGETDHRATFASSTDTSLINGDDPSATFSSLYTFKNSFYPVYVFSFSHSRGPLTSY